jgi:RNA polymerase sigma-70 factor, ECF subfamily
MTSAVPKSPDPPANVAHFPLERVSDAELVQAACDGDSRAVGIIWSRYSVLVRKVLIGALGPDSAVEDLLQEVFIAFLQGARRIEQASALRGYLTSVAVRQAALELRRRKVRRWVTLTPTGQVPDTPTLPRDGEGREALAALYRVLDGMGSRERLAFVLRHIEGMEILEVARALRTSESTVRRALGSARSRLDRSLRREPALRDYLGRSKGEQP